MLVHVFAPFVLKLHEKLKFFIRNLLFWYFFICLNILIFSALRSSLLRLVNLKIFLQRWLRGVFGTLLALFFSIVDFIFGEMVLEECPMPRVKEYFLHASICLTFSVFVLLNAIKAIKMIHVFYLRLFAIVGIHLRSVTFFLTLTLFIARKYLRIFDFSPCFISVALPFNVFI